MTETQTPDTVSTCLVLANGEQLLSKWRSVYEQRGGQRDLTALAKLLVNMSIGMSEDERIRDWALVDAEGTALSFATTICIKAWMRSSNTELESCKVCLVTDLFTLPKYRSQGHASTLLRSLPYTLGTADIVPAQNLRVVSARLSSEEREKTQPCVASTLVADADPEWYKAVCGAERFNSALGIKMKDVPKWRASRFRAERIYHAEMKDLVANLSKKLESTLQSMSVDSGKVVLALDPAEVPWLMDVRQMYGEGGHLTQADLDRRNGSTSWGVSLVDMSRDTVKLPIWERPFALTQNLTRPDPDDPHDVLITMMGNVNDTHLPVLLCQIKGVSSYGRRSDEDRIIFWNPDPSILTALRELGACQLDPKSESFGMRGTVSSWLQDGSEVKLLKPDAWAFMV